eukprot:GFYU01014910.1.p1 GENE.GFYU01014910.1~~GFYU01014910.1.p1  ORF type:complete len:373 (+),score=-19.83 GFYU01014910.1:21-1139(+)
MSLETMRIFVAWFLTLLCLTLSEAGKYTRQVRALSTRTRSAVRLVKSTDRAKRGNTAHKGVENNDITEEPAHLNSTSVSFRNKTLIIEENITETIYIYENRTIHLNRTVAPARNVSKVFNLTNIRSINITNATANVTWPQRLPRQRPRVLVIENDEPSVEPPVKKKSTSPTPEELKPYIPPHHPLPEDDDDSSEDMDEITKALFHYLQSNPHNPRDYDKVKGVSGCRCKSCVETGCVGCVHCTPEEIAEKVQKVRNRKSLGELRPKHTMPVEATPRKAPEGFAPHGSGKHVDHNPTPRTDSGFKSHDECTCVRCDDERCYGCRGCTDLQIQLMVARSQSTQLYERYPVYTSKENNPRPSNNADGSVLAPQTI